MSELLKKVGKENVQKINDFFDNNSHSTFWFACHAALPLFFRLDWLFHLWANFKYDIFKTIRYEVSYSDIADLLNSSLLNKIGLEIYEFNSEIRAFLINELRAEFGSEHLRKVAAFLYQYSEKRMSHAWEKESHQLIAWSIESPFHTAAEFGNIFNKAIECQDQEEQVRLFFLLESLTNSLTEEDKKVFEPLKTIAEINKSLIFSESVPFDNDLFKKPILTSKKISKNSVPLKIPEIIDYRKLNIQYVDNSLIRKEDYVKIDYEKSIIESLEFLLKFKFRKVTFPSLKKSKHLKRAEYAIQKGQIKGLRIDGFNLLEIPDQLTQLDSLKYLSLSQNKIRDIHNLPPNLTTLFLNYNEFELVRLKYIPHLLEVLDISYNKELKFINFEEPYENLNSLNISNCSLEKIIIPEGYFNRIQTLNLQNNKLRSIKFEGNCPVLELLDLGKNELMELDLPFEFERLQNLYLNKNKLVDIHSLQRFFVKPGFDFLIKDNPELKSPPLEIVNQGKETVINYFLLLQKEQAQKVAPLYNFEVKLMLIGEGGTGKTTLLRKLQDVAAELPNKTDTTYGIEINKWIFNIEKNLFPGIKAWSQNEMLVNCWDFGGQKIYHGTQQIFFGENSYYILVVDTRKELSDINYWLNTIEYLAGDETHLLIVINEKYGHSYKFDKLGYKSRFPFITDVVNLDLDNEGGRNKLKTDKIIWLQNLVKQRLQEMPKVGMQLPSTYIRIREELFRRKENYIHFKEFQEICRTFNLTDPLSISIMSNYFHEIGAITHFINDPLLKRRVFLNSDWLVKMVYLVLDEPLVKEKNGRINDTDFDRIWKKENLDFEIAILTKIMHRFGLMYQVENTKKYIIPAHLPTAKPYENWVHENEGNVLSFKYEFDRYMPEGLMSTFIVSISEYITEQTFVWNLGVNIEFENTYAEIIEYYVGTNGFQIKIAGSDKKGLLTIIRSKFYEILKPFKKLEFKELIPCICKSCISSSLPYYYEYIFLKRLLEKRKDVQCNESGFMVSIRALLDFIEKQEPETNNLYKDNVELLIRIKNNSNDFTPEIISKYLQSGFINAVDLRNIGIPKEIIEATVSFKPTNIIVSEIPERITSGFTEVYFWGLSGSGKTTVLAGILNYANNHGLLDTVEGPGFEYMIRLKNLFLGKIGFLPSATTIKSTICLPIGLRDTKGKKHPISLIDLSSEIFECFVYQEANLVFPNDNYKNMFATLQNYLSSPNRKIHFFIVDLLRDPNAIDDHGYTQNDYLISAQIYLNKNGIFKRKTDAIYVIATKSDLIPGSEDSKPNEVRKYLMDRYPAFINYLKDVCRKFKINDNNLKVIPFIIGKVYFKNLCQYNPNSSGEVVKLLQSITKSENKSNIFKLFNR